MFLAPFFIDRKVIYFLVVYFQLKGPLVLLTVEYMQMIEW